MDLGPSVPSSLNTILNQVDGGFYQFVQEQEVHQQPILLPLPPAIDAVSSTSMDHSSLMGLSTNSFVDLMETQRYELEQYLKSEYAWLRCALLQQSNQCMVSLMGSLEFKASILLKQKDEEFIRARDQVLALEECLRRGMEEKGIWEKIAKEKESMIISLRRMLQEVRKPSISSVKAVIEGRGSSTSSPHDEKSKSMVGRRSGFPLCKSCGCHLSCVLLIPCQHLCACKQCAAFLNACPVCQLEKLDSIEISLE